MDVEAAKDSDTRGAYTSAVLLASDDLPGQLLHLSRHTAWIYYWAFHCAEVFRHGFKCPPQGGSLLSS